jgi:hypothetical protein
MPSPVPLGAWVIDYVGQHWLLECLTKHLIFKREEDRSAITLITRRMQKLQKDIAKMHCSGADCMRSVGRTYRMVGKAVFCVHCCHETGGQG